MRRILHRRRGPGHSAKASIVRGDPLSLETHDQLARRLEDLVLYDLPTDCFDSYTERIEAVTLDEVNRVAHEYLDPERFAIVIVGDRSIVEAALRELPYPMEIVTLERPVILTR